MAPLLVLALVAVAGISTGEARLSGGPQPAERAHGLSVSGAKTASGANPEVDAWHDAERSKIEAECDERLRQLRAEKRRKLAAIIDQREQEADETGRALQDAQRKVQDEAAELDRQKKEAEDAVA